MASLHPAPGESRPGPVIAAGVIAGVVTVAVVAGALWLLGIIGDQSTETAADGTDPRLGSVVIGAALQPRDCMNYTGRGYDLSGFTIKDCDAAHLAEVTAKPEHPDARGDYPGQAAFKDWLGDRCSAEGEEYVGLPLLDTTLAYGSVVPTSEEWATGDYRATCIVESAGSITLTESVWGLGEQYLRDEQVVVSRLKPGDCFTPTGDVGSYDLNSNSVVNIVDCGEPHNGVFFGRGRLELALGELFPGEEEIGDLTSQQCAVLFRQHFDVAADGFNYRYWRPNQQSWNQDDRSILCAVLDANPMTERFDPSTHDQFFALTVGQCFNLGPEENTQTLRLDDRVRVLSCDEPHVGQMIGSGELEVDLIEAYPSEAGVKQLAGAECESLFDDFVGISPYESDFGKFPFWYPNEPGWNEGDRRYACAFLEEEPRTSSLENAEA